MQGEARLGDVATGVADVAHAGRELGQGLQRWAHQRLLGGRLQREVEHERGGLEFPLRGAGQRDASALQHPGPRDRIPGAARRRDGATVGQHYEHAAQLGARGVFAVGTEPRGEERADPVDREGRVDLRGGGRPGVEEALDLALVGGLAPRLEPAVHPEGDERHDHPDADQRIEQPDRRHAAGIGRLELGVLRQPAARHQDGEDDRQRERQVEEPRQLEEQQADDGGRVGVVFDEKARHDTEQVDRQQ